MKKALSDIDTMQYLYDGEKTDWVASAAFYAMYHSLLAVLYKLGYESRNQECTITAIEILVENKKLSIDKALIDMIRNAHYEELESKRNAKSTREEMQYSAKLSLGDARCKALMRNAISFVEKMRAVLKEL